MAVQCISDKTNYVITHGKKPALDVGLHLQAMLKQVETLRSALQSEQPWQSLSKTYPELGKLAIQIPKNSVAVQQYQENLLHLYRNYVDEWDKARNIIEIEVINTRVWEKAA